MPCSPVHTELLDSDTVTRFVNNRNCIEKNTSVRFSPNAFMFPKSDKALSLVHIDGLSADDIWNLGDTKVFANVKLSAKEKFKTVARADMIVGELKKVFINDGFCIERDNCDFDRHVTALSNMEKQQFATKLAINCLPKMR
ncbi:MAG: hypothetical protein LE178_04655 [Endomicrobium sp.]|nr:hypothetical protein [Endomicrobium sp.]